MLHHSLGKDGSLAQAAAQGKHGHRSPVLSDISSHAHFRASQDDLRLWSYGQLIEARCLIGQKIKIKVVSVHRAVDLDRKRSFAFGFGILGIYGCQINDIRRAEEVADTPFYGLLTYPEKPLVIMIEIGKQLANLDNVIETAGRLFALSFRFRKRIRDGRFTKYSVVVLGPYVGKKGCFEGVGQNPLRPEPVRTVRGRSTSKKSSWRS